MSQNTMNSHEQHSTVQLVLYQILEKVSLENSTLNVEKDRGSQDYFGIPSPLNLESPHSPTLEDPSDNPLPGMGKFTFPDEEEGENDFFLSKTAFFSQLEERAKEPQTYDEALDSSVDDSSRDSKFSSQEKSGFRKDPSEGTDDEEGQEEMDDENGAGDVAREAVQSRDIYEYGEDVRAQPLSHWFPNDIKPISMPNFVEVPIKVGLSRKAKFPPLHAYLKTSATDDTKRDDQRKKRKLGNED